VIPEKQSSCSISSGSASAPRTSGDASGGPRFREKAESIGSRKPGSSMVTRCRLPRGTRARPPRRIGADTGSPLRA
jgi:hypothetical protein